MRPGTMIALNVAGTVILVSVFYWFGRDHSVQALMGWAALFFSTLVFPMHLSAKIEAELAKLPKPVPRQLSRTAVYPVWIGLFALAAAIALVGRLR